MTSHTFFESHRDRIYTNPGSGINDPIEMLLIPKWYLWLGKFAKEMKIIATATSTVIIK